MAQLKTNESLFENYDLRKTKQNIYNYNELVQLHVYEGWSSTTGILVWVTQE